MVPLMVLEGGYLVLLVVDFVGDRIVLTTHWCQRLKSKELMYAKEAIERKKHVTGECHSGLITRADDSTGDYGSTSTTAGGTVDNRIFSVHFPTGATPAVLAALEKLDQGNSAMGLMAVSSLRNHLSNHPKDRTNALKLRLLKVCRIQQDAGHWTKDHAAVLREILPMFTELGEVLEQAQASTFRTADDPDKPQPPV